MTDDQQGERRYRVRLTFEATVPAPNASAALKRALAVVREGGAFELTDMKSHRVDIHEDKGDGHVWATE